MLNILPGQDEIATVRAAPAQDNVRVGIVGVPMVDREPLEPRPQGRLGAAHHIAHIGAHVADAQGRPKRHRMLLLLDEFPMLGRMPFFEVMMGAMAGYGLKASLVCQSLHHVTKTYGRENVIVDNCHIVTAFAANDEDTSERIAKMAGEVWELRESHTHRRPRPLLGWRSGTTTVREERRPLLTSAQVRALPRDEQLVFVSGARPLRAKKLRFDEERVLRRRLRPSSTVRPTLSVAHDWRDVRALGLVPKAPPLRSRPAMSERGLAPQPDLFDSAAVKPQKISEIALAGFRGPDGEILPPPGRENLSPDSGSGEGVGAHDVKRSRAGANPSTASPPLNVPDPAPESNAEASLDTRARRSKGI